MLCSVLAATPETETKLMYSTMYVVSSQTLQIYIQTDSGFKFYVLFNSQGHIRASPQFSLFALVRESFWLNVKHGIK